VDHDGAGAGAYGWSSAVAGTGSAGTAARLTRRPAGKRRSVRRTGLISVVEMVI